MIDPNVTNELMTTQDVARRLKVHVNFVLDLIRDGKLEAHLLGKGYRISEEALQRYLESTKVEVK